MPRRLVISSIFGTTALDAKDFTIDPEAVSNGKPTPVFSMSAVADMHVLGQVIGPPGHSAFLSLSANAFNLAPGVPSSYFPEARMVPCGSPFELHVLRGQTVYGLASISPTVNWGNQDTIVLITYAVYFLAPEEIYADGGDGPGGDGGGGPPAGTVEGPGVIFRKR